MSGSAMQKFQSVFLSHSYYQLAKIPCSFGSSRDCQVYWLCRCGVMGSLQLIYWILSRNLYGYSSRCFDIRTCSFQSEDQNILSHYQTLQNCFLLLQSLPPFTLHQSAFSLLYHFLSVLRVWLVCAEEIRKQVTWFVQVLVGKLLDWRRSCCRGRSLYSLHQRIPWNSESITWYHWRQLWKREESSRVSWRWLECVCISHRT